MINNFTSNSFENALNIHYNNPYQLVIKYTLIKVGLSKSIIALILLFIQTVLRFIHEQNSFLPVLE